MIEGERERERDTCWERDGAGVNSAGSVVRSGSERRRFRSGGKRPASGPVPLPVSAFNSRWPVARPAKGRQGGGSNSFRGPPPSTKLFREIEHIWNFYFRCATCMIARILFYGKNWETGFEFFFFFFSILEIPLRVFLEIWWNYRISRGKWKIFDLLNGEENCFELSKLIKLATDFDHNFSFFLPPFTRSPDSIARKRDSFNQFSSDSWLFPMKLNIKKTMFGPMGNGKIVSELTS